MAACSRSVYPLYPLHAQDIDPRSRSTSCPTYNARKEFRASEQRPWLSSLRLVVRALNPKLQTRTPEPVLCPSFLPPPPSPFPPPPPLPLSHTPLLAHPQVRIDGLEHIHAGNGRETLTLGVVGMGELHIFIDPTSFKPSRAGDTEFVLNKGAFQISLYRSGMLPQSGPDGAGRGRGRERERKGGVGGR